MVYGGIKMEQQFAEEQEEAESYTIEEDFSIDIDLD